MRQNPAGAHPDVRKARDPAEHHVFRPSKKPPDRRTPAICHKPAVHRVAGQPVLVKSQALAERARTVLVSHRASTTSTVYCKSPPRVRDEIPYGLHTGGYVSQRDSGGAELDLAVRQLILCCERLRGFFQACGPSGPLIA